ncbi:hypothetical protein GCM10028791_40760 [Echinicola sediminis]
MDKPRKHNASFPIPADQKCKLGKYNSNIGQATPKNCLYEVKYWCFNKNNNRKAKKPSMA